MAWNYIKQKPVPTPDANKNNKPVKTKKTLIKQGHKGYKNFVSWS